MLSTERLHKFFARLNPTDTVLLVGDVRQHQAIEAGSPFEQLQKRALMMTAELSEIVRQRDRKLRQTVSKLSLRKYAKQSANWTAEAR